MVRVGVLFVVMVLVGCVSTINNKGQQFDKQQALEAHLRLGLTYLQKRDRVRLL